MTIPTNYVLRFLNFNSEHHFQHKLNTINNLKHRATQLSHPSFHQKNLQNVKTYLLKNNYPVKLVDKLLRKPIGSINKEEQQTLKKYYKIPYSNNLS
ncbi:unnamed protein product, partial [Callosobruchus maculatus]